MPDTTPVSNRPRARIAIVGAGLMGRLIALSLHRQGYRVTLFDQDDKSGHQSAAYAAAGLLTPLGEAMHCEANIVAMGFESLKLWPDLLATLDAFTFFQQQGAIVVSHEQDTGDYLRFGRFLANHYPQQRVQHLNRAQLEQLEPEIGRAFKQALFLPDEGEIGNRKLLIALRHQLEKEHVDWRAECRVLDFATHGRQHGYRLQYRQAEKLASACFDLVIDCRGSGARKKANRASGQHNLAGLRAVRGELLQLYAPAVHITRPVRLMHPRYQLYIAPKRRGYYVVGATEIESDDDAPVTVQSAMELMSAAYSVHPGFAEANIRQHVSQLRPAFNDNQPKIVHSGGLIQVNGLYRHGFLIAPVVLEQVNQLVKSLAPCTTEDSAAREVDPATYCYSHLLPIGHACGAAHERISR